MNRSEKIYIGVYAGFWGAMTYETLRQQQQFKKMNVDFKSQKK